MGIVYRARQLSLNRWVAVKMILPGGLADESAVRRFHTEAQAAAQLRHPHIVAVHEVGVHQGRHFYSMDLIEGESLARKVRQYPLTARQAARYVQTIAAATHFAHERQVLHRDLKPSNILIDAQDQPHITDFGLAKLMAGESEATLDGVVMGSPSYIAPEQAQGRVSAVGVRSDVYSLGAILYELITGRPPFQGESASATLKLVVEAEPIAPRLMNPKVPRDLETLCLKCLEKEPARRYASARALAEDLDRYLNDRPVLARRVGVFGKTERWCRRNPAMAAVVAVGALVLVLGLTGVAWQWQRAEREWRRAEAERRMHRLRAYAADMRAADAAIEADDLGQAISLLERYLPQPGEEDVRGVEWRYLWRLGRGDDVGGFAYASIPFSGDLSPDGQWMITASLDGWVRVHDWQGRQALRHPAGYSKLRMPEPVVAFSPRGEWAAAATLTQLLIWETRRWQLRHRLPCREGVIAFSPDGGRLAAIDREGLQVWSTQTWRREVAPADCLTTRGSYQCLAFTPDGSLLALANRGSPGIGLWSLRQRQFLPTNFMAAGTISLAISPNGRWLAAGSMPGEVRVWDLVGQSLAAQLNTGDRWTEGLAFSPDSRVLATAGSGQRIYLWQAGTTNRLGVRRGHRWEIWGLRFSSDGKGLVSWASDRTLRRWSTVEPAPESRRFQLPDQGLLLDVDERGARAQVLNTATLTWEEWDLARTRLVRRTPLEGHPAGPGVRELARLYGRHLIVPTAFRGGGEVFDIPTGRRLFPPPGQTNLCRPACVAADGRWLSGTESIAGQWVGGIWDLKTGQRQVTLQDQVTDTALTGNAAFSPDGQLLAYETCEHEIHLRHLASGRTRSLPGHGRALYTLRFSPDNRWLASGGWDSTARVWDAATGQPITPWLRAGVDVLHFSPDSRTLVTGDSVNGFFRVWHVLTGTEMLAKRPRPGSLQRTVDSETTLFLTGTPPSETAFIIPSVPKLFEIDALLRADGAIRPSSGEP